MRLGRCIVRTLGLVLVLACCTGGVALGEDDEMNIYQTYLKTGETPSLFGAYEGLFPIGAAISPFWLANDAARELIKKHFNSVTCENEMKADFVLSFQETIKKGDLERAAIDMARADKLLKFAQTNGIGVRAHTLIWHSQVPRWFFNANYELGAQAQLASREVMLLRMENYIQDVMAYVNENYPGVVYAWDVVNEGIEPGDRHPLGLRTTNNLWYDTIGDDFIEMAFTFARKYAAPGQTLFYNDYNCYENAKVYLIRNMLRDLRDKGLVDGLGMQGHIGIDSPSLIDFETALTTYASLGIEIQITELDVKAEDSSAAGQMALAVKYRRFFAMLKRLKQNANIDITSVTLWGLTDDKSWLSNSEHTYYPLLFNPDFSPKSAFFGALLDTSIPMGSTEANLSVALEALGITEAESGMPDAGADAETGLTVGYKPLDEHNPVMTQRFGADPYALVYEGRVYLYMTGDVYEYNADGSVKSNTYSKINTINILSSDDLVNWTDHGSVKAAGSAGAAKWASNSWAPAAACKEIDGEMQFFLYFANSAGGIGVLTSASPTGPFVDPLGKPLISRRTPNCADVTWLFDPAVLVDTDGHGYLYFGGGVPEGKQAAPGTARAVALGADMISIIGEPVAINAPYLFEDSGINRIGDTYYYSYCTNFNVDSAGAATYGFKNGEIAYMTSASPLGPFTYQKAILKNPGDLFGVGGNNHHCLFEFAGQHYIAYHTQVLERKMGTSGGYRSTFINPASIGADGEIDLIAGSLRGGDQVKPFNPFTWIPGGTMAAMAGLTTFETDVGKTALTDVHPGDWFAIAGVDFGEGAKALSMYAQSEMDVDVKIVLDAPDGECVGRITLQKSEGMAENQGMLDGIIYGRHDLYFVFEGSGAEVGTWRFLKTEAL